MSSLFPIIKRPADLLWRLLSYSISCGATEVIVENYGGIINLKVHYNGTSVPYQILPSLLDNNNEGLDILSDIAPYAEIHISSGRENSDESGIMHAINGRIISLTPQDFPQGMEISVTNLFFNHKEHYMKYESNILEKKYCIDVVRQFYLCYGVSIRWKDSRGDIYIPASNQLTKRINQLYGNVLFEIELDSGILKVMSEQWASCKYSLAVIRDTQLLSLPRLNKVYSKICEPYRRGRCDIPVAVLMLNTEPDEDEVNVMIESLQRELPYRLTKYLSSHDKVEKRTEAKPGKIDRQVAVIGRLKTASNDGSDEYITDMTKTSLTISHGNANHQIVIPMNEIDDLIFRHPESRDK